MKRAMNFLSYQQTFTIILTFVLSFSFGQTPDSIPENMCGFEPSVPYSDPYAHSPSGQEICTDPSAVKYVRLAFHFLLPGGSLLFSFENDCADPDITVNYYGAGNFTEYGDGATELIVKL